MIIVEVNFISQFANASQLTKNFCQKWNQNFGRRLNECTSNAAPLNVLAVLRDVLES